MSGDAVAMERLFPVHQEQLTSDDYYTPAWVFERMGLEFDLDVCAPPGGIDWIPAKRYFTQADDGLVQPWEGRVWMNPPFSQPAPWARRFIDHHHGVAVIQVSKSAWMAELWDAADAIAMRRPFLFAREGASGGVFMPVAFFAFGDECVDAIGRLGTVRKIA